jgi:hypothetical protein
MKKIGRKKYAKISVRVAISGPRFEPGTSKI